jgi:DNA-directed RNA polymerase subunit K/omega
MVQKKEEKTEEVRYTKYEIARMLGSRALQLALGAPFLVKISEKELERLRYNPLKIAEMELSQGVLPITVKRPLPGQKK